MSELKETLKKRHKKIVEYINEIWSLEKEKFQLRITLEELNNDLNASLNANSKLNFKSKKNLSLRANYNPTKKSIKRTNEEIKIIEEKQNAILDKVKNIINL